MKTQNKADEAKDANRLPSATQTIQSQGRNIRNMEKLKMATAEELVTMKTIHNTIVQRWLGGKLEL